MSAQKIFGRGEGHPISLDFMIESTFYEPATQVEERTAEVSTRQVFGNSRASSGSQIKLPNFSSSLTI